MCVRLRRWRIAFRDISAQRCSAAHTRRRRATATTHPECTARALTHGSLVARQQRCRGLRPCKPVLRTVSGHRFRTLSFMVSFTALLCAPDGKWQCSRIRDSATGSRRTVIRVRHWHAEEKSEFAGANKTGFVVPSVAASVAFWGAKSCATITRGAQGRSIYPTRYVRTTCAVISARSGGAQTLRTANRTCTQH